LLAILQLLQQLLGGGQEAAPQPDPQGGGMNAGMGPVG
jgi:hypothetical protein